MTKCNFVINLQYIFYLFLNMLKSASSLTNLEAVPQHSLLTSRHLSEATDINFVLPVVLGDIPLRPYRINPSPTVSNVTVASVLYDVTKAALDLLVAGKIECVCGTSPQHSDIEAPQGPKQALCLYNPLQCTVHTAVLSIWVRL